MTPLPLLDEPVSVPQSKPLHDNVGYRLPPAPFGIGPGAWIPPGQTIQVAGTTISGGMVYVGTSLMAPSGSNDPCLIDPSKPVSARGDSAKSDMGYWPSYSEISSTSRRAYLNWLAAGRSDPNADIGYVFLFFYGLERRAIVDASQLPQAQADWPIIAEELRRLLVIYADKSASFKSYASELLNWVSMATRPSKMYELPVPDLPRTFDLPLYLRLAIGQAAMDKAPIPVHLALAWIRRDPSTSLRTPATRCPEAFDALFAKHYAKVMGAGLVIAKNKTKLKFVYQPASSAFRGFNETEMSFGETPDITVLTAPITKLRDIAEIATKELEPYSRFLGRNPQSENSLEALLNLPAEMWPEAVQKAVKDIQARATEAPVQMAFQDLLKTLGGQTEFSKDKTVVLAKALASMQIGMEPDVLTGARMLKPEEPVVLFNAGPAETSSRATPAYQAALLTLQLASTVVMADGEFSAAEMTHLRMQVSSWVHLTPEHRQRLTAHLHLLAVAPVPLASLKKRLDVLPVAAKESIATFMAAVAQSDGTVSASEVKVLERVYKALGLDPKKVFGDVHAAASGATAAPSAVAGSAVSGAGFKLDAARIAALQQDTAKVSALLAGIFNDSDLSAPASTPAEAFSSDDGALADGSPDLEAPLVQAHPPAGILGLDEAHSALARMLLSRPQWTREELLDVATDLDLMLDGALEHINEAAFDAHDIPFTEGDDPVDVNAEVREKIEA